MILLACCFAALILAVIELAKSRLTSLMAWAIGLLALAHVWSGRL